MPELPEVESVRRQLAPRLTGRRIEGVELSQQRRFLHLEQATGCWITAVGRRGKYLIVGLSDGLELVANLGMTGSFRLRGGPDGWSPDHYVRASFALDDGVVDFRDVRRFGRLAVVPEGEYGQIATLAALGPEPLGDGFEPAAFYTALAATRMPIKPALLSQRPVAGVGNIYADEALWQARINPRARRVGKLRTERLWSAIRQVLSEAIEREGTTFRDYRMTNGESGRNAAFLAAYGRAGSPCRRCGAVLRKVVLAGRGTTYCTRCQRA
jgi:formamidopyrimidine-DNA glycosylase